MWLSFLFNEGIKLNEIYKFKSVSPLCFGCTGLVLPHSTEWGVGLGFAYSCNQTGHLVVSTQVAPGLCLAPHYNCSPWLKIAKTRKHYIQSREVL